jgi:hypothetical protein
MSKPKSLKSEFVVLATSGESVRRVTLSILEKREGNAYPTNHSGDRTPGDRIAWDGVKVSVYRSSYSGKLVVSGPDVTVYAANAHRLKVAQGTLAKLAKAVLDVGAFDVDDAEADVLAGKLLRACAAASGAKLMAVPSHEFSSYPDVTWQFEALPTEQYRTGATAHVAAMLLALKA